MEKRGQLASLISCISPSLSAPPLCTAQVGRVRLPPRKLASRDRNGADSGKLSTAWSASQLFVKGLSQVTHDLVGKANTHFLSALWNRQPGSETNSLFNKLIILGQTGKGRTLRSISCNLHSEGTCHCFRGTHLKTSPNMQPYP